MAVQRHTSIFVEFLYFVQIFIYTFNLMSKFLFINLNSRLCLNPSARLCIVGNETKMLCAERKIVTSTLSLLGSDPVFKGLVCY